MSITKTKAFVSVAAVMGHKDEFLAILSSRKPRTPKVKPAKKQKPAVAEAT